MKLWKHLRAHWRAPFYAFCEWYVFGRDSNWEEVPTPRQRALEASVAPGADIYMSYEEAVALVSHTDWRGSFRCEHMRASGVRAFTCGICGPLRPVSA